MKQKIELVKQKILGGKLVSKEEVLELMDGPLELLGECANAIRKHFCGNEVDLCSIINGKSGACSENCKYCAQSAHHKAKVQVYELLDKDQILEMAVENEAAGVGRYSIVTSGKSLSKSEVAEVCEIYRYLGEKTTIKLCASHGLLSEEDFEKLLEVGVVRYHNNLETSRAYFSHICTTHTYDEKIKAIKAAQKVGLEVCSGGLFGMGETMVDRIDMAFELRDLGVKSVPINALLAIEGTPLAGQTPLAEEEILRIIALYRLILPDAFIRLAGGRMLLTDSGKHAFEYGANATITGNLLTTCGNTIADDMKMLSEMGLEVKK